MKVTIGLDNLIVLDGDDIAEIATFVKALRNGAAETKPEPKRSHRKKKAPESGESLPEGMGVVWSYLVANDNPEGVMAAAVAEGLEISTAAAASRLQGLQTKKLAYRVSRGRYRPGVDPAKATPPEPAQELPQEQPVVASESAAEPLE